MEKIELNKINHPHGNLRSNFFKFFRNFLQFIITFFLSFFCNLKKDDKIFISVATYAPWIKDKKFSYFYNLIKNFTLLDETRSYTLWKISSDLKDMKGDILDVGCLLGGSGFIMSKNNKIGSVILYDSFEGFKETEGLHKKENIFFYRNINFVKRTIKYLKLKNTYVEKTFFPNNLKKKIKKIKICHLDVNTYKSTKKAFYWVEKKIVKGGVIIFDDFGIWGVDGIKKFINDIEPKFKKNFLFINNHAGQCILIKK